MVPAFQLSCSEMVNKWEKKLSKDGSCELDIEMSPPFVCP